MTIDIAASGNTDPMEIYKEIMRYYERFKKAGLPYSQRVDNWCLPFLEKQLRKNKVMYKLSDQTEFTTIISFVF